MKHTEIAWCHSTFNAWEGCTKVGPGCDNCYAESRNQRFHAGNNWGPGAPRLLRSDAYWREPLKWERDHENFKTLHGCRQRVFCSSLADVFDNEGPADQRARLFELIKATPHLDWLILTKRIGNAVKMLPADWGDGYPNVWLGATVVNQEEANRDIPKLLSICAKIKFLSLWPLLGPIEFAKVPGFNKIGLYLGNWWVVSGGESGHNARPSHPDWHRSLRNQCKNAGVPFLFKQWGEWLPDSQTSSLTVERVTVSEKYCFADDELASRVGTKKSGRLLDGVLHDEFPT